MGTTPVEANRLGCGSRRHAGGPPSPNNSVLAGESYRDPWDDVLDRTAACASPPRQRSSSWNGGEGRHLGDEAGRYPPRSPGADSYGVLRRKRHAAVSLDYEVITKHLPQVGPPFRVCFSCLGTAATAVHYRKFSLILSRKVLGRAAWVFFRPRCIFLARGRGGQDFEVPRAQRDNKLPSIGCTCGATQVMPPLDPSILVDHIKAQGRRERKNPGGDFGDSSLWTLDPHERLLKMPLQKDKVTPRKYIPVLSSGQRHRLDEESSAFGPLPSFARRLAGATSARSTLENIFLVYDKLRRLRPFGAPPRAATIRPSPFVTRSRPARTREKRAPQAASFKRRTATYPTTKAQ